MMETTAFVETAIAAAVFAAVFLLGSPLHPIRRLVHDTRGIVSFGAGMSAAYVFVHVMPELNGARAAVREAREGLPFEGMSTYFVALLGFLVFYGLGQLGRRRGHQVGGEQGAELMHGEEEDGGAAFRFHLGGFAVYVLLMGYLLVRNLEETSVATLLFAAAIAAHFLSVDHSLREEYGSAYERRGRYVLAAMAPLGWLAGQLFGLPIVVLAAMIAFISGAVIVNSAVMELPNEKDGRLLPFLAGGLLYGIVLLPLG